MANSSASRDSVHDGVFLAAVVGGAFLSLRVYRVLGGLLEQRLNQQRVPNLRTDEPYRSSRFLVRCAVATAGALLAGRTVQRLDTQRSPTLMYQSGVLLCLVTLINEIIAVNSVE